MMTFLMVLLVCVAWLCLGIMGGVALAADSNHMSWDELSRGQRVMFAFMLGPLCWLFGALRWVWRQLS